jgi:glutamate formiminotransferase / 5-formyltetrahydrofolate cyclo-ligase
MGGVLECVINVSEGQRAEVLAGLAAACGDALLDVHTDGDHHRSVFTLAAADGLGIVDAALALARAVAAAVDISVHRGVHPRLGALDVVPFVALEPAPASAAAAAAQSFAEAVARELALPVFLYDGADPEGRTLPSVRREAFVTRAPDRGPPEPHPRLGAVCVGARLPLVAINCNLPGDDLALAAAVARTVRERDGGLPGVRALAFPLPSQGQVQVSMNLVDLAATGLEAAITAVASETRRRGSEVAAVELVGLVPAAELDRCSPEFLSWAGLGPEHTVEARLRAGVA